MNIRLYIPYIIGGIDKPIPYLYQKIIENIDKSEFDIKVFRNVRKRNFGSDNAVYTDVDWTLKKWMAYLRHSLNDYDLLHTGGGPRFRYYNSVLTHLYNDEMKHIHTLRIDVDREGTHSTGYKAKLVNMSDVVTAVSEHTAQTAQEEFSVDPKVIYNGVDIDKFNPTYQKPELFDKLNINSTVFIFVGQLIMRKRPHHIVKVAERVPTSDFLIIGDGPMYEELKSKTSNMNNVHVTGRLAKSKLPKIYANSTALIFPSVREGCPNVVLESMASETPIVGYRSTSMPELIENRHSGYLSEKNNIAGLIKNVEKLSDVGEAARLGKNARNYVEKNHRFDIIAEEYSALYRTVVK